MTARKRELSRADRVLPGLWRLRLPLPWPGVPHVNAFAIAAVDGVVLVDTGLHEPGAMLQLERALHQAGLRLEHVRLLVCTHAHSDHYGLAAPIVERSGCELWMHPNHAHMTKAARDPDRAFERGSRWPARAACPRRRWPSTSRRGAARASASQRS
jgi:glyoxylase-like metal-dependent hydrolase (beta-lactamase superfamily II)